MGWNYFYYNKKGIIEGLVIANELKLWFILILLSFSILLSLSVKLILIFSYVSFIILEFESFYCC